MLSSSGKIKIVSLLSIVFLAVFCFEALAQTSSVPTQSGFSQASGNISLGGDAGFVMVALIALIPFALYRKNQRDK